MLETFFLRMKSTLKEDYDAFLEALNQPRL